MEFWKRNWWFRFFKDKKAILYATTLLVSDDLNILSLCLDILENCMSSEEAQDFLLNTFGIYEAIESLGLRYLFTIL